MRALDRVPHAGRRRLERALGIARDRDALAELRQGHARLFGLSRDLPRLDLDGLHVPLHAGVLLPRTLDVFLAREALGQAGLHRARELADLLPERGELGTQGRDLGLTHLDDRGQTLHFRLQLAQLTLARQQRMLRRARGLITAAVEPPGRAEDFPARRDVRRDDAVTPPEALRLVQVLDDRDLAEQMMNQARRGGAHAPGDPANTVVARDGVGRRRQMLERKERRRPERVIVQVRDGRARVLEPLDDHPLEPLAQYRLDGALHAGGHFEEIGHGADDAVQRVAAAVGEDGAHAGPITFARALELG